MTRFALKLSFFCYLLLIFLSASAQKQSVQKYVDDFIKLEQFKSASIGIELRDLKTGELLAEHQSEKSLTPASTQKLITTATALELWGSNFKFKTEVLINGRISINGQLLGNLIIKGFGDPSLGSKYFPEKNHFISSILKQLKKLGIRQINGKIITDSSYFKSSIPRTWIWEDIGNYYGAVPHALSYKDNTYTLHFASKEAGKLTTIKQVENKQADLNFSNEVLSSTINRDRAYIFGGTTSSQRRVEGTIPQNRSDFKVKGAVSTPETILQTDLEAALDSNGILVKNEVFRVKNQKTLLQFLSPPLSEIVALTNQKSINLFADHLLFEMGIQTNNKGDWESGIKTIKEFWQTKGIDSKGLFLYDGSGLSHFNAVSASALNQVLIHMSNSNNSQAFFNSLPIAGENGTLKHFGKHTKLAGNFRAKTGSMTGVRSYSGLLTKKNGEKIVISLIINNYSCSVKEFNKKLEELLIELAGQ